MESEGIVYRSDGIEIQIQHEPEEGICLISAGNSIFKPEIKNKNKYDWEAD